MNVFRTAAVLLPLTCLVAQTPPPKPAPNPAGTPIPTVQSEIIQPQAGELPKVDPDKVILSVGTEKLTAGEFARIIETLPENVRGQARGAGRRQLAEGLIKIKLLAQEARKVKADQDPMYNIQKAYQIDNLLAVFFINNYLLTAKIDDAEAHKYYEAHKGEYERAKARHILIRMQGSPVPLRPGQKELSDAEALAKSQEIRKKLAAGADFAALAKEESDDSGSGANGGDLGTFGHGQMVPAFDQTAFSLPIGQLSEPVKTQFGYHIIKVEERTSKTLEEMRPEIGKKLRPDLAQKYIAELRKQVGVTVDESLFAPK